MTTFVLHFVTAISVVLFPSIKRLDSDRLPDLYKSIRDGISPLLLLVLIFISRKLFTKTLASEVCCKYCLSRNIATYYRIFFKGKFTYKQLLKSIQKREKHYLL